MPIFLVREETQGPRNREWTFSVRRTRQGSDVIESTSQPLAHEVVVEIYQGVVGPVPPTGLELSHVLDNWADLEPLLRNEIETLIDPS